MRLIFCVLSACLLACREPDRPSGRSWSVATHPRAADRYARLLREFLDTPDPRGTYQRRLCEHARLADALGTSEAGRRIDAVYDTVLRTRAARAAYDRSDAGAALTSYQMSGPICDSLNAIADREDGPIPPAPDSLRER